MTSETELRRMRMLGSDCTYTGKGDGPYCVVKRDTEYEWCVRRADEVKRGIINTLIPFAMNNYGPEAASMARAVCYAMNERHRLKTQPTPTAEWLPGGANYDAMAQEDRFDTEDAAKGVSDE